MVGRRELLIGGWDPAANWDVHSDAAREKLTMVKHCELLSVGLVVVGLGEEGQPHIQSNKTMCLWVCGGWVGEGWGC